MTPGQVAELFFKIMAMAVPFLTVVGTAIKFVVDRRYNRMLDQQKRKREEEELIATERAELIKTNRDMREELRLQVDDLRLQVKESNARFDEQEERHREEKRILREQCDAQARAHAEEKRLLIGERDMALIEVNKLKPLIGRVAELEAEVARLKAQAGASV